MVKLSKDTKRRISSVVSLAKTVFHWGFIPTVLYLVLVKQTVANIWYATHHHEAFRRRFPRERGSSFFSQDDKRHITVFSSSWVLRHVFYDQMPFLTPTTIMGVGPPSPSSLLDQRTSYAAGCPGYSLSAGRPMTAMQLIDLYRPVGFINLTP